MHFVQLLVNGIVTGLIVALPALALSFTFAILRFANFAIGAMLTFGAYTAYVLNVAAGWPLVWAACGSAVLCGLACVATDRAVYRRLRGRTSVTLLVASMGVAFFFENIVRLAFGNSIRGFDVEVARPIRLGELRVNHEQIVTLSVTCTALFLVWFLLTRTKLGRAMRAVADDPELAAVRGVDSDRVIAWTWFIVGGLTAIAAVLIGLDGAIEPLMGWNYVIIVFAAAILGGLASPMAAVAGALLLGVVEELATLALPSTYRTGVAFALIALLLLFRPWGLFGKPRVER